MVGNILLRKVRIVLYLKRILLQKIRLNILDMAHIETVEDFSAIIDFVHVSFSSLRCKLEMSHTREKCMHIFWFD